MSQAPEENAMIIRVFRPTIHAGKEAESESFLRDSGRTLERSPKARRG